MPSLFRKSLKSGFNYQVELQVNVPSGRVGKLVKYVTAWSKTRAKKKALALALKDIKIEVGTVARMKGLSAQKKAHIASQADARKNMAEAINAASSNQKR